MDTAEYTGLARIIGGVGKPGGEIIRIPIDKIAPNPYQPRKAFAREQLVELAQSISQYGVLQPISVRRINGAFYELVAGERRLRAGRLAGLTEIPAIVMHITDRDSAMIALIENLQREGLSFMEEAEGYANLISDYSMTQEQLARQVGKSQSAVANKLRLLRLPESAQRLMLENGLTERHARALLRLNREDIQLEALERVIKGNLNVKKTEDLIEGMLNPGKRRGTAGAKAKRKRAFAKPFVRDIRIFKNTIKQAVDVMNGAGLSADYDVEERDGGCLISIKVVYNT